MRNSIRTGASYTAIILALLVAFAAAGVNFGNIAIVAGALSVGIGFGLQSIVNNFVSGLILLAERPIKVGDWVSVTAGEGTVTKINVRATEIETFDRCSIIVPNSSLISDAVQNWTHGDLMGRAKVLVGVSYDADPQQVHDILVKCAQDHPRAMAYPLPSVLFKDFGASSLDFEVRVFINDVNWVAFVASELRFSIHKALKEAGIEIPFPQRDVQRPRFPGRGCRSGKGGSKTRAQTKAERIGMAGLDHVVHCTGNFDGLRTTMTQIGFTLTPPAEHPFGTGNSLVQLDGFFLEFLHLPNPHLVPKAAEGEFGFAAHNAAYMKGGGEGVSMLVFESADAAAEQARFAEEGLDTYKTFDFSRLAKQPDGEEVTVGFSLAFATHADMPRAAFFYCQQHAPEYFWKSEYQRHANTAAGSVRLR